MPVEAASVTVSLGSRSYDILIKSGLVGEVGARLRSQGFSGKVGVVTNPTVARLYARPVLRSMRDAGLQPFQIVVPEGERAKTLKWTGAILDRLVRERCERKSALVALGGGVVGDLTGFAAAIYQRGIPFVQVPTTLVAQVDSSVGGKTGVNHPLGKNLIGSFHQPQSVLIDPDTLNTLPIREWVAGVAEVIKYGLIADERLFAYLEQQMSAIIKREAQPVGRIIQRSCQIKAEVVAEDEREADRRRILNYGHTIGHALESLGGYRRLIHGEAVAIGMACEASLAESLGYCTGALVQRQRELLIAAGLPVELPDIRFAELWAAMQHDKKVSGGQVFCIFPKCIGQVVVAPVQREAVRKWLTHTRRTRGRGILGKAR